VNSQLVSRVGRLLAGYAGIWLVLVSAGLLLTKVLHGDATTEGGIEHTLAAHRTPLLNTLTHLVTLTSETAPVIATVAVLALLLRWWLGRWTESAFLVAAVAGQAAVFLLTTLVIHRARPTVSHLDAAPPTSSFPSGHTGAAVALWVSLTIVAWRVCARWLAQLLLVVAVVLPIAVGMARLYRGMHHPTDIVFGVLNGLACVLLAYHTLYSHRAAVPEQAGRHHAAA
jgi:undecaprenyl-diphosphatase